MGLVVRLKFRGVGGERVGESFGGLIAEDEEKEERKKKECFVWLVLKGVCAL